MENLILDAALRYAANGWRILPLHNPQDGGCSCGNPQSEKVGKHPRALLTEVTNDVEQVKRWWSRYPNANIGLTLENLTVLDIDASHGGITTLAQREAEHGPLVRQTYARTGSGGSHFLFALVDGGKASSNVKTGLDIRTGPNAYIVVAPSLHESGRRYEWIKEPHPQSSASVGFGAPEAPDWVRTLARKPKGDQRASSAARRTPTKTIEQHLTEALARVSEGAGRNDSGFALFAGLKNDFYERAECAGIVEEWLRRVNDLAPGDHPYPREEATNSLKSAFTREPREPKKAKRERDCENLAEITADMRLFHDAKGDGYAEISVDGHKECWSVRSPRFKQVVLARHLASRGEMPGSEAVQNCIEMCDLKAQQNEELSVFVPIGYAKLGGEQRIFLDLGNKDWGERRNHKRRMARNCDSGRKFQATEWLNGSTYSSKRGFT